MLRSLIALCLLVLASACTQLPKVELQAYREAFAASQAAAQPLIESYTVREREATIQTFQKSGVFKNGFYQGFAPKDAELISSLSTPPGAEASRRAFEAITEYNDVLVALAENRNIDEAQAQIKQITADLEVVKSNLPGLGSVLPITFTQAGTAVGELLRVFTPLIQEDNRKEFSRVVVDGYPHVQALIATLRELTTAQYSLITRPLRDRWDEALGNPTAQEKIAGEINGWHTVFADYVVMLNVMDERLGDLEQAVRFPKKRPLLGRAAAGASDVRAYSDILRRSLAALHTPK